MSSKIRDLLKEELEHVKFDKQLGKTIKNMRLSFMNRNEDHLAFFSGNLLGVNPVRFTGNDSGHFFNEILEIDEEDVVNVIKQMGIDPTWVRANDPINLTSVYLLHGIYNSNLPKKDKEEMMFEVTLLLHYKFITSSMSHNFPYPADPKVAMATYEALSRKFGIKEYGSWQALLEAHAKDSIDPRMKFFDVIIKMDNDTQVINYVQAIQQRIKEVVKKMTKVFHRVRDQNLRISSTSNIVRLDSGDELKDRTRDHTAYTRYLKDVLVDKPTLIRKELIDIISDVVQTMNPNHLVQALEYCSDNFDKTGDKNIEILVDELMLHTYRYLTENVGTMSDKADLGELVFKLKNIYTASRMSDPQIIKLRDLAEKIVKRSVKTRNSSQQSSVRVGLQLYLIIRAFSKKYYQ